MQRVVTRAQLAAELRRIEREGAERLVSVVPDGDEFVITTEQRDEPRMETR